MTTECTIAWCRRPRSDRGLCRPHYDQWRYAGKPEGFDPPQPMCTVEGCDDQVRARGWCLSHYSRWRKTGSPLGRGPVSRRELLVLRRAVGVPDDGPSPEQTARWIREEART
jgi:hypothetical protein